MRNDEAPLLLRTRPNSHPCFGASPFSALLADWYNAVTPYPSSGVRVSIAGVARMQES